ncbi:phosphotransferase enzyme family protein [Paenibacillus albiflavus]|uniref:phosphotransferase enzyme family protein n=1 Tax=Paenibacillus albiflavus TaxID=2545760 RepID=UPI0014054C85|nr:phosphotransferase [Paenibacillus albiflavus]
MLIEAEKVLMHYSFIEPIIEFIRHNENITFKVTNKPDNRKYLLRIHKPISDGFSGLQHTRDGLQSEMVFLREIDQKNILKVQRPVLNKEGELVTEYISDQFGTSYATLLEWIEGSTLSQNEDNIDQIIYRLGENLASLHEFSQTLMPLELHRPVYNAKRIDETLTELRQGTNNAILNQEDYDVINSVLSIVKEQLVELDSRENTWGYIHADFQLGNVIVSEQNQYPFLIDYCLFGYGYYLFDLGSASSMLKSELRKTFLDGYASKTSFSFDDIRYIEGQIFMDIFISYVFFINDSEKNGWIKEHASKICNTLCRDFLEGKEVYYAF